MSDERDVMSRQTSKPGQDALSSYVQVVGAVAWKDALTNSRNPEALLVMIVFSLLSLLIYAFAFGLEGEVAPGIGAGMLWMTFAFAGILGFYRIMASERESGCLDGLLLAPVDRSAIFFGKWIGGFLHLLLIAVVLVPALAAFFGLPLLLWKSALVVVLFAAGYAALGTLLAAMTLKTGAREILLPLLLLPPAFPILLAATQATRALLMGAEWHALAIWVRVLVACDAIFLTLAWMVYDRLLLE